MKLILFLLRSSWRVVLLAGLVGGISGAASVGLVVMILHTLELLKAPNVPSSVELMGVFAALCVVILLTQIASQVLLARLTQTSVAKLQVGLCRRILESPLKHLEEIGSPRMLASLTGDVSVVSQAMNGVPVLGVNLVILVCGAVYLGWLSPRLLLGAVVFCIFGMASYWYSSRFAQRYVQRAREEQNLLQQRIQELIEGVKELKVHHARRREFVDEVLQSAETTARRSQFIGDSLNDVAIAWGRLTFFIAIGLLLFAWPSIAHVDAATLTAYSLIIFYLMSPLEQIMGWLPFLAWATASVRQIEHLGLMLEDKEPDAARLASIPSWQQIELAGVTHVYRREGQPHGFVLGPIDLSLRRGEIVFIIGGNGSGKTTLGKLITGLYTPEGGEICLDGEPIAAGNRESYRQLFSVVFDDAMVFDGLWGLDAADLDRRADEYLRQLELDHVVTVTDGRFSTLNLSRGQRKRLALLTAYLEDRPVYVFDEWAADQDPAFRRLFYLRLLPELKSRGKTVVAITHDDRYFANADRIVKLEEGKVVKTLRHELPQEAQLETL
jgi:putative pyoverdin transport system ATP-binding/permease protein